MLSLLMGFSLLILGDSHFRTDGYLISTLQNELIQRDAEVTTYAA